MSQPPPKLSDSHLRQCLSAVFGDPDIRYSEESPEDILQTKAGDGSLTVPGGTCLSVVAERFPVLADLLKVSRSTLVKILEDREDETVMVVDSILPGAKALFFARILSDQAQLLNWLELQQWPCGRSIIQPMQHEKVLIVSSLDSFVVKSVESTS